MHGIRFKATFWANLKLKLKLRARHLVEVRNVAFCFEIPNSSSWRLFCATNPVAMCQGSLAQPSCSLCDCQLPPYLTLRHPKWVQVPTWMDGEYLAQTMVTNPPYEDHEYPLLEYLNP